MDHLKELRDIYFVQNKIQKIEGLDGLAQLRNLELAANRIRVGEVSELRSIKADRGTGDREPGDFDRSGRALVGEE